MIRWFSIRRLLLWTIIVACVLVTAAFSSLMLKRGPKKRSLITAARKAYSGRGHYPPYSPSREEEKERDVEDTCVPLPFVVREVRGSFPLLVEKYSAPFGMQHADMRASFGEYLREKAQLGVSMEDFLWNRYRISAVPPSKEGVTMGPLHRYILSIRRHVALFYGEYLLRGGESTVNIPVEACAAVGLEATEDEQEDERFEGLHGAQGSLLLKTIPHAEGQDGKLEMVVKYIDVDLSQMGKTKEEYKLSGADAEAEDPDQVLQERLSRKIFGRELAALSSVKHQGVIRPICYEKTPKPKLVLPLMQGDMIPTEEDHLAYYDPRSPRNVLSPDETFLPRFLRQLVEALYELHVSGFLHLDVKPENVLVHGPDRHFILPMDHPALERYHAVLTDLGLARRWHNLPKGTCVRTGTEPMMAPEQVMCNHDTGRAADWWSLAVTAWRLRILWEASLSSEQREELLNSRDPHWGHFTTPPQPFFHPDLIDLLAMMLKPDPKDRSFSESPEALAQLLDHPYLLRGLSVEKRIRRLAELGLAADDLSAE